MMRKSVRLLCCAAMIAAMLPAQAFARGVDREAGLRSAPSAAQGTDRGLARRLNTAIRSLATYRLADVLPDAYEPDDDTPQTISDANLPLLQNRTIEAADYDAGNVDWDGYTLTGTPGTLYTFETTGTADTVLVIENSDTYESLGWYNNKADGSYGSKGYWRCTAPGQRVDVWVVPANPDYGTGDYTMSITGEVGGARVGEAFREYGSSKYAAAINSAKACYSVNGSPWHYYNRARTKKNVSNVFVVSGDSAAYVSAMIAQPLASWCNAPILLVSRYSLPSVTKSAIQAIRNNNGGKVAIHVVGPTSWVAGSTYTKLKALRGTGTIERIYSTDRYALAAKIADRVDAKWYSASGIHSPSVIVANGSSTSALTDLLVSSGIAARQGWPILLTKTTSVPSATYSRVRSGKFKYSRVIVPNSTTYVNAATFTSASGDLRLSTHSDRSASALDIARQGIGRYWFTQKDVVVVDRLSEALTVGTYAGWVGSVVLVSDTYGPTASTSTYFNDRQCMVDYVSVVGSSGGITSTGLAAYQALLK